MWHDDAMDKHRRSSLALMAAALASPWAAAQGDWPAKPIRIVVPFAPGGIVDTSARVIGQKLHEAWGQQVIVENRGGANVAPQTVAKGTPDGYSILVHNNTVWISPLLDKVPYDHWTDLVPITLTARSPNILVVHPSLPAKSIRELVALGKSKVGTLTYASGGSGSQPHLAGELLQMIARSTSRRPSGCSISTRPG